MTTPPLLVTDRVERARAAGVALVALESSLVAQGLPPPHNLEAARASEAAVRAAGAEPATIALADGRIVIGAGDDLVARLADPASAPAKAASRDLAPLLAARRLAGTTVSATLRAAHLAGIDVFATGGIGGVHRGAAASFDVSSDIDELADTRGVVVCSGAKSILDLVATLEVLETRRVPIVGLGTDELPAFLSASSGLPVPYRAASVDEAADMAAMHLRLGRGSIVFVQPPPPELALERDEIESLTREALAMAAAEGVTGPRHTPRVLSHLAELSGGRTLRTNIGLIISNARTAAELAVALRRRTTDGEVGYDREANSPSGSRHR